MAEYEYWEPTPEEIAAACRKIRFWNAQKLASKDDPHEFIRCLSGSSIPPVPMFRYGWETVGNGSYRKKSKRGKDG